MDTRGDEVAKNLSRAQFGANAANYATSSVHAKGASLQRMVELARPEPAWHSLDIATAAGHTALAVAPHVESVVATDITPEMIELCAKRAEELGLRNVDTRLADAEDLPFDDGMFDLVTCRIAPHHFPNPGAFVDEAARVLKEDGIFVMVDNVVPDDPSVALRYNAWEKARDPSHVRSLSITEWVELCTSSSLAVEMTEEIRKQMSFRLWVDNMSVPEDLQPSLLEQLIGADSGIREFLQPEGLTVDDATFVLTEGLICAHKMS